MRGNGHGVPVVALDIDGTIADYHGHFLRFAEGWFGGEMPRPSEINPGMRLHEFMGVSHEAYRKCKLAFRQGGMKRTMPALTGVSGVIRKVRIEWATEVWICTTRPYNSLSNIDDDTKEWLHRNGIGFDALLFDTLGGDDKYGELVRQSADRVAAVVEDLPEQVDRARMLGLSPILLRDQPYNKDVVTDQTGSFTCRWEESCQLEKLLGHAIRSWRSKQKEEER